jgi:hypothetical protein
MRILTVIIGAFTNLTTVYTLQDCAHKFVYALPAPRFEQLV